MSIKIVPGWIVNLEDENASFIKKYFKLWIS